MDKDSTSFKTLFRQFITILIIVAVVVILINVGKNDSNPDLNSTNYVCLDTITVIEHNVTSYYCNIDNMMEVKNG